MSNAITTSTYLVYAAAFIYLVFAGLDGFTPRILPFHEAMLGMTHEELPAPIAGFALFLLRIIAAGLFSTAVTLAVLVKGPYSDGHAWARTIIGVLVLTSAIPLAVVMLSHSWSSPWPAPLLAAVLTVIALYVSRREFSR